MGSKDDGSMLTYYVIILYTFWNAIALKYTKLFAKLDHAQYIKNSHKPCDKCTDDADCEMFQFSLDDFTVAIIKTILTCSVFSQSEAMCR